MKTTKKKLPETVNWPEYLDFFGSLFTTAIVNWAKWLHPEYEKRAEYQIKKNRKFLDQEEYTS